MGVLDIVPVSTSPSSNYLISLTFAQAGVLTGDDVRKLFDYAKENKVQYSRIISLQLMNPFAPQLQ